MKPAKEHSMSFWNSYPVRTVLLVDAATCVAMGAVLTAATGLVATLTAIPSALLFYAGLALFPIAAFMVAVAMPATTWRPGVWLVIIGNVLWVVASLWLMVSGWITPNALGYVFITAQALAVALLAALEYLALRRASITDVA
jgi:hypothetical protein